MGRDWEDFQDWWLPNEASNEWMAKLQDSLGILPPIATTDRVAGPERDPDGEPLLSHAKVPQCPLSVSTKLANSARVPPSPDFSSSCPSFWTSAL